MSKKILFHVFLLIFSFSSFGASKFADLSFSYQIAQTIDTSHRDALFNTLKMSLQQDNFFFANTPQGDVVSAMFFTESFDKAVFVKYGFTVDKDVFGEVITLNDGFLYHGKDQANGAYALFFQGFEEAEVVQSLKTIKAQVVRVKKSESYNLFRSFSFALFPSAHAQEECARGIANNFGDLENASRGVSRWVRTAMGAYRSCVVEAFVGIWNGSVGSAFEIGKTIGTVLQSANKVWPSVSDLRRGMQLFKRDVDQLLNEFRSSRTYSAEERARLICGFLGTLTSSTILAYSSSGLGAPLITTGLALQFERFMQQQRGRNSSPRPRN